MSYIYILILVCIISFLCGYFVISLVAKNIPKQLHLNNINQKQKIINEAKERLLVLRAEEENLLTLKNQMIQEEYESIIKENMEKLQNREEELDERELFIQEEEVRLNKQANYLALAKEKLNSVINTYNNIAAEAQKYQLSIINKVEEVTGQKYDKFKTSLKNNIIENYKIEQSRNLKFIIEEINNFARKHAYRILSKVISKYKLDFVWPKTLTHIEINNLAMFDVFDVNTDRGASVLSFLNQLAKEVDIEAVPKSEDDLPFIKLSGGYGIDREALKLTIEKILQSSNKFIKNKDIEEMFNKNKLELEHKAMFLGEEAVRFLKIKNIHPELQKMIGSLYWRTSYRQNQYYHSLEVAMFCWALAEELGLDVDVAKRCGILHDIGKSLDYKIEGSHAIISADYADRYGESLMVCNVILSHHDDIHLEHPLAHVLIAADTISGARPGSRLNLEEGYQDRLAAIYQVVQKFPLVNKIEIMYGGREVHIEVSSQIDKDEDLRNLSSEIARNIEKDVSYPGQIKVILTRKFEAFAIA